MAGTTIASDGRVSAWITARWTNPTSNFDHAELFYRENGATAWMLGGISRTPGATSLRVEGSLPGTNYQMMARAVNAYGLHTDSGIASFTAPTDSSIPTAPSAIAVRQSEGKTVEIHGTFTAPLDWGACRVLRSTVNNSGTATEIARGKSHRFHDKDVTVGVTHLLDARRRHLGQSLRVLAVVGHSVTVLQIQSGEIGDNQVPTQKFPAENVTLARSVTDLSAVGTTSASHSDVSGTSVSITTGGAPCSSPPRWRRRFKISTAASTTSLKRGSSCGETRRT